MLKRWGFHEATNADKLSRFGRTSFAQEGEDVLLRRILANDSLEGSYVDVGANHPFHMSNTALFYQMGWTGVAIDPNPLFAEAYATLRPRDVFINCGIANQESVLTYYRFNESLLNTFSKEKAKDLASQYGGELGSQQILVKPLAKVLNDVWPDGKTIRFLSVDCEGFDHEVIESHDFEKYPVEFVCVENHVVNIRDLMSCEMLRHLESCGYIVICKLWCSVLLVHEDTALKEGYID